MTATLIDLKCAITESPYDVTGYGYFRDQWYVDLIGFGREFHFEAEQIDHIIPLLGQQVSDD